MRVTMMANSFYFWPKTETTVTSQALTRFYTSGANRLMTYLCLTLFSGLATLLALEMYGQFFQIVESSITFRGIYAWETALNFGLCHLIIDEGSYRIHRHWLNGQTRSVYSVRLIWLVSFMLFMILQRTVIYARTIDYYPKIIAFYNTFPEARPDWFEMTLFCFPFWLITTSITLQMICAAQTRRIANIDDQQTLPLLNEMENKDSGMFINSEGKPLWIKAETITHITVEDHYCRFFIQNNETSKQILTLMPLKEALRQLPPQQFLQIHRSHVVRINAVSQIEKKGRSCSVFLKTGDYRLPVSRHRMSMCYKVLHR